MLTQKKLKEVLSYDPKTGIFIWKVQASNSVQIGSVAGKKDNHGYQQIGINGKSYLSHRLAWLFVSGYFPENQIDHKNRIRHNNWIDNLREASNQCNARNSGNRKDNTSGVRGVCFHKKSKKWVVKIMINQKPKHLGSYSNFDNAACARLAGEQACNWSNCDNNSPAYQFVKTNIQTQLTRN